MFNEEELKKFQNKYSIKWIERESPKKENFSSYAIVEYLHEPKEISPIFTVRLDKTPEVGYKGFVAKRNNPNLPMEKWK